jgi:lipocalin
MKLILWKSIHCSSNSSNIDRWKQGNDESVSRKAVKTSKTCSRSCSYSIVLISMLATLTAGKRRTSTKGQRLQNECGSLDLPEDFNIARFMGLWYEIMSYPFCLTTNAKCVISTYAFVSNRNITIYSRFVNSNGLENRMIGMAAQKSPGRIAVMFSASRKLLFIVPAPTTFFLSPAETTSFYNVLNTDYEDFSVVVACNSLCGRVNGLNVWILSRHPALEPKFIAKAFEILRQNEIETSPLRMTPHDCNFDQIF